jgi:hypothetical protein
MKKWFEYQIKNQRDPNYIIGSATQPIANVQETMHSVFQYIKEIYNQPRVTKRMETIFSRESSYANSLKANVPHIDLDTLEEWVYDDQFYDLLNRPSHEVVYFHEPDDYELILDSFCQGMSYTNRKSQTKGFGSVKMHVQHPGQIFPFHFDRPQHVDFQVDINSFTQVPSHQRYIIFIEDQQPGQLFQMDHDLLHWRAGDVFTWDARNTMHGSATVGYWPRYMLMITLKNQEFTD